MGSYGYGEWRSGVEDATPENYLDIVDEGVMILEPKATYGKAVIGYHKADRKLVYSHDRIVGALVEDEGISLEEAYEWVSYNTIRACQYYDNAPKIVFEDEDVL